MNEKQAKEMLKLLASMDKRLANLEKQAKSRGQQTVYAQPEPRGPVFLGQR